jgi:hypothetical protein
MAKKCKFLVVNYKILPSVVLAAFSHKTRVKITHWIRQICAYSAESIKRVAVTGSYIWAISSCLIWNRCCILGSSSLSLQEPSIVPPTICLTTTNHIIHDFPKSKSRHSRLIHFPAMGVPQSSIASYASKLANYAYGLFWGSIHDQDSLVS